MTAPNSPSGARFTVAQTIRPPLDIPWIAIFPLVVYLFVTRYSLPNRCQIHDRQTVTDRQTYAAAIISSQTFDCSKILLHGCDKKNLYFPYFPWFQLCATHDQTRPHLWHLQQLRLPHRLSKMLGLLDWSTGWLKFQTRRSLRKNSSSREII